MSFACPVICCILIYAGLAKKKISEDSNFFIGDKEATPMQMCVQRTGCGGVLSIIYKKFSIKFAEMFFAF